MHPVTRQQDKRPKRTAAQNSIALATLLAGDFSDEDNDDCEGDDETDLGGTTNSEEGAERADVIAPKPAVRKGVTDPRQTTECTDDRSERKKPRISARHQQVSRCHMLPTPAT
jgi:hypothetical protein